jgi:hypothetical protein
MITIGRDEPVVRGNRYCGRVGLASVPRVQAVLDQDLDKDDINLFRLMVVALLEHGGPMTVEETAERLSRAGAVARSGNMVLALKTAWHGTRTGLSRSGRPLGPESFVLGARRG